MPPPVTPPLLGQRCQFRTVGEGLERLGTAGWGTGHRAARLLPWSAMRCYGRKVPAAISAHRNPTSSTGQAVAVVLPC